MPSRPQHATGALASGFESRCQCHDCHDNINQDLTMHTAMLIWVAMQSWPHTGRIVLQKFDNPSRNKFRTPQAAKEPNRRILVAFAHCALKLLHSQWCIDQYDDTCGAHPTSSSALSRPLYQHSAVKRACQAPCMDQICKNQKQ